MKIYSGLSLNDWALPLLQRHRQNLKESKGDIGGSKMTEPEVQRVKEEEQEALHNWNYDTQGWLGLLVNLIIIKVIRRLWYGKELLSGSR